jgi:mono/diheme cytochrome c family protein
MTELDNPGNGETFSFATDVKPIIDANCIQCHNGSQFPDLRDFSKISANKLIVKNAVSNRRMPLGGSLTNAEINAIVGWIDSGALNN